MERASGARFRLLRPGPILQGGLLLSAEAHARRWLTSRLAWTATVAINVNIMTLFIWHLSATTVVVLALPAASVCGLSQEVLSGGGRGSPGWP